MRQAPACSRRATLRRPRAGAPPARARGNKSPPLPRSLRCHGPRAAGAQVLTRAIEDSPGKERFRWQMRPPTIAVPSVATNRCDRSVVWPRIRLRPPSSLGQTARKIRRGRACGQFASPPRWTVLSLGRPFCHRNSRRPADSARPPSHSHSSELAHCPLCPLAAPPPCPGRRLGMATSAMRQPRIGACAFGRFQRPDLPLGKSRRCIG